MTPESVKGDEGKYEQIEGESWERYLLALLRGWAAEEARLGAVGRRLIKDVRLVGDCYPHWGFELDTVSTLNGKEGTSKFPIEDWDRRGVAKEAVSEILLQIMEGG